MNKFSVRSNISPLKKIRDGLENKNHRPVIIIAVIIAIIIVSTMTGKYVSDKIASMNEFHYETILDVSSFIDKLDNSWHAKSDDSSISEIKLENGRGFDGISCVVYFYRPGTNKITLSNDAQTLNLEVSIDENYKIQIRKLY